MKDINKYLGCIVGGAAGDALGYAVEFLSENEIDKRYGRGGIRNYELKDGYALISDDTQMTLYTADGLLCALTEAALNKKEPDHIGHIRASYKAWLKTQQRTNYKGQGERYGSWLANVERLCKERAPGLTCMSALASEKLGSTEHPINDSKGCGGVMRVAPIGLLFDPAEYELDETDMLGAEAAAITHGNSLGYIPAAALVHLVAELSHGDMKLRESVSSMRAAIRKLFAHDSQLESFERLTDKAVSLSEDMSMSDRDAIHALGEGWVGDEAFAIALFCALRYENDFEGCIIAAVNHGGDSDSTGAIAGNILGAHLGIDKIPENFLSHIELSGVLAQVSEDLLLASDKPTMENNGEWLMRYLYHSYTAE